MSEFKGTPGPWELDEYDNVVHGVASGWGRKESVRVSGVTLPGRLSPEYKANTRLVAAAPELLEACLRIQAQFRQAGIASVAGSLNPVEDNAAQIDAVILKALG